MDPTILYAATIAGSGATLAGGILAANAFSTARLLGTTGPTPMAELTAMLQEVRGTVIGEESRTAPVSGRSCVFWRLLVEQQRRTRWEAVLDQRDGAQIWLDDGTGRVRIDPREAESVATSTGRVRTGVFATGSPEWADLVGRVGTPENAPTAPFLRWREEIFEVGDTLTAVGRAAETEGGWELGPDEGQLILSDRDDAQVVRQHRRNGQRWALIALAGLGVGAWGAWSLLA